ncbi:MAG: glycosyltransferase family 87 protein [Candidatus Cloacimonadales bacterium]|nr:glycosyltransferase family 87 protein [Candidatus Cloacimonadales bacterium]
MKKSDVLILINTLLIFAIFLSITGFFADVSNTVKYGGVDLRNRVVGARVALNQMDPYFYKWSEGSPEYFLDPPDHPNLPVNRVTVPPTVLQFHSIFCDLPYSLQRFGWTIFQWVMLLSAIALLGKSTDDKSNSKLIWIVCLFFVADSYIFRLHVERGQIYILYTFLIALSYYLIIRLKRNSDFWSGLIAGYASALRFPMLLIGLPFLLCKRWKFLIGQVFGFAIGISASFLFIKPHIWKSYFSAMNLHGLVHEGIIKITSERYPHINIDGIKNLYIGARLPVSDSSVQGMMHNIGIQLSSGFLLVVFSVVVALLMFFFLKIKNKYKTTGFLFLLGSIIIIISEIFLPAARYNYSDVIMLIPLSLVILDSKNLLEILKQ